MTIKQNIALLQGYIPYAGRDVNNKVIEVVRLYENGAIPNFKTAKNALEIITSKHKATIKANKPTNE